MAKFRQGRELKNWKNPRPEAEPGKLRVIGGRFSGRQIQYSGDLITRPMKDNIREAVFNLIGGWVKGKAVFDLFAGTGAMGIEALSREATRAFFIERHFPTVRIIKENVKSIGEDLNVQIDASDTFFWIRDFLKHPERWPSEPWMIFFCPPYAFYKSHWNEVYTAVKSLIDVAPAKSVVVVESDETFDASQLPFADSWRIRQYAPAQIAVYRPDSIGFMNDEDDPVGSH